MRSCVFETGNDFLERRVILSYEADELIMFILCAGAAEYLDNWQAKSHRWHCRRWDLGSCIDHTQTVNGLFCGSDVTQSKSC